MNYSPVHMFARDHLLSVIFLYTVFYILWFHYLETTVTGNYLVMHTRLDELIPFLLVFIILYLLWLIYIFAALLHFSWTDKGEVADLCPFSSLGMTIVFFICIVSPNGADFRISADPANGFSASLAWMIQSIDTPTNVFPSIHVFNVLAVHVAVTWSCLPAYRPLVRRASLTLMLLTRLSTIFLRQHSTLDVSGALLLDYLVNAVVYGNYEVPALISAGANALLRRKKSPAKAYRQPRKK